MTPDCEVDSVVAERESLIRKSSRSARTSVRFTPLEQAKLRCSAVANDQDVAALVRFRVSDIIETGVFFCAVCQKSHPDSEFSHRKFDHPLLVCLQCGGLLPEIICRSRIPEKWIKVIYHGTLAQNDNSKWENGVCLLTESLGYGLSSTDKVFGASWHRTLDAAVAEAYRLARKGIRILEAFQDSRMITLNVKVVVTCDVGEKAPACGSLFDEP